MCQRNSVCHLLEHLNWLCVYIFLVRSLSGLCDCLWVTVEDGNESRSRRMLLRWNEALLVEVGVDYCMHKVCNFRHQRPQIAAVCHQQSTLVSFKPWLWAFPLTTNHSCFVIFATRTVAAVRAAVVPSDPDGLLACSHCFNYIIRLNLQISPYLLVIKCSFSLHLGLSFKL